ncbi:MAG: VOC family protein [Gammaproteobacteria bacterium]|nr:VOC family protein [Gammaproteobacteria bacterium]
MIDHLSTYATHYEITKSFYEQAFQPLGYSLTTEFTTTEEDDEEFPGRRICSFGKEGTTTFWVIETKQRATPRHVAFTAHSEQAVDAFYQTALKAGARDNGTPGLRPHYHPGYYGAFVFDPDGNDIEAVFHGPS